jgi:RecB family exonuclease
VYYGCSLFWLYARVFAAEEFSLDAALLDDTSLGILYHKILEKIFAKIKNEDRVFSSGRLDVYKNWTQEITREAIREHPAFKGPLAVPLVYPQAAKKKKKIERLLELEAANFSGYEVSELELPVSYKSGDLLINGIVDRVSVSPDGRPVIVDYKTNYLPEQTAAEDLAELPLSEFQMPLYIKLYEEMAAVKAEGAFFYSVNGRRIKAVVGEAAGGRSKAPCREEYEPFLEAAEKQIEEFGRKVKALDFIPREIRIRDCLACAYKTACRTTY